eukprot:6473581-Amphidinium_carterae.1
MVNLRRARGISIRSFLRAWRRYCMCKQHATACQQKKVLYIRMLHHCGTTMRSIVARKRQLQGMRHQGDLYSADQELTGAWNRVRNTVVPGHSQWLKDCLPFMTELFGMPSNLPPLAAQQLWLHMKTLERSKINFVELFRSTRHPRDAGAPDAVHAWREHGAIASLRASLDVLCRLGLLQATPLVGGGVKHIATRDPHSTWRALLSLQRLTKGHAVNVLQSRWDQVRRGEAIPRIALLPSFLDR